MGFKSKTLKINPTTHQKSVENWTRWRPESGFPLIPERGELQQSSFENMKVWIIFSKTLEMVLSWKKHQLDRLRPAVPVLYETEHY